MNKIKVLFLINSLGGGGAERVLVNLVNNMDHDRFDVTVQTIFKAGVNKSFLSDTVTLTEGKHQPFKGISLVFKLLPKCFFNRYFSKRHYDVAIAYLQGAATKMLWSYRGRKIAWLHCDIEHIELESFFFNRQIPKCFDTFDKIAGVSDTVCDSFERLYGLKDKLVTVYNTNDTEKIKDLSNASDYPHFLWNDYQEIKLITLGRLIEQKGYDRLVAVCRRLKEDGVRFRLLILGDGAQKESLQKMILQNGMEEEIELGGFIVNPYPYIKQADLFVCSSRYEGLSTAMSETLILGTPIITTRVSGAEEALGDSEYGLIVENDAEALYEGLKSLLSDPLKINHYRKQAIARSSFFDMKTTVGATERLIENVAAN